MVENIIKQRRGDLSDVIGYCDVLLLLYRTIYLEPS